MKQAEEKGLLSLEILRTGEVAVMLLPDCLRGTQEGQRTSQEAWLRQHREEALKQQTMR